MEMKNVHEVPDLVSSGEGKDLVSGCIRVVQAVPALRIQLHGEEPEGAVLRPLNFQLLLVRRDDGPMERGGTKQPCKIVAGVTQCGCVLLRTLGDTVFHIVEEIEILGEAGGIVTTMKHRRTRQVALRAAVGGDLLSTFA